MSTQVFIGDPTRPLRFAYFRLLIVLTIGYFGSALTCVARADESPPLARPVDGQPFAAALGGVTSDWTISFTTPDGERKTAASELVAWGNPADANHNRCQLLLTDGSLIVGDVLDTSEAILQVETERFGQLAVPWNRLCGVIFQPSADTLKRDRLEIQLRLAAENSDQLMLANGDTLAGSVLAIRADSVQLTTQVGNVEIPVARVAAVILDALPPQPRPDQQLQALVGFADGSRLVVSSLVATGNSFTAQLVSGLQLSGESPGELVALQPLGGRATYLSDLTAHSYQHVPYLDHPWPYRTDASVVGGRLRAGGRQFSKGLGMHSASRITYRIPRETAYRRLDAELAVDDTAGSGGSVRFRVFLLQAGAWAAAYESPLVRGGQDPLPVSIELGDALAISLLVDHADRGDVLDHANWLNARLVQ